VITRRAFIGTVTGGLLAAPLVAEAQPSTTIPRIGLLADAPSWEPLRLGLRDLGYVEGKSIALEERSSQGRNERFSGLASELVRLVAFTSENRLPAMYQLNEAVDRGGLMSYGANLPDLSRRAATYVDKILKGAKPGDLPVEQPTKFELVINLKTTKTLGPTIPSSLLGRADEVIE
jgi:hypothetical protein